MQAELRDHEHVVECIAWANDSCRIAINESVSTDNKKGTHEGPFLVSGSRDKTLKVILFKIVLKNFNFLANSV